jgi:hypothetical protein
MMNLDEGTQSVTEEKRPVREATIHADHDIQRLMELINGFQTTQAIHVAVTLGIPDLLRNGAVACDQLASATGSHPGALYRLLRALAAVGIMQESEDRRFALTRLGGGLVSDAECSRNAWVKFAAGPPMWAAWGHLLHSVRSGETGFRRAHGQDVWSFRAANRAESALFDLAMREHARDIAREMLSAYDFTQFSHIVDVGGGNGTLIAGLLAACQQATGTLLDLAHVVAGAGEVLEQAGVSQRCKVLAGSFFDSVPAGGDVYVLKSIVHDWDDREAQDILRNCRRAMSADARLLVVERMLAPPNEGLEGKLSDLNMLVNAGGRERTSEEFTALLAGAGFEVRATSRLPRSRFIMEAIQSANR